MKFDNEKFLLIIKIVLFICIIISPFINYSLFLFFNRTFIKITILLIIVGLSFWDIQIAILVMILFLIVVVSMNKIQVKGLTIVDKPQVIPQVIPQKESFTEEMAHQMIPNKYKEEFMQEQNKDATFPKVDENNYSQTIANFPQPYCGDILYDPTLISDSINNYSLDFRTKPYEEYIQKIASNESLFNIQNNSIIS